MMCAITAINRIAVNETETPTINILFTNIDAGNSRSLVSGDLIQGLKKTGKFSCCYGSFRKEIINKIVLLIIILKRINTPKSSDK